MEHLANCLLTLITFNQIYPIPNHPRHRWGRCTSSSPLVAIGMDVPRFSVVDVNLSRGSTRVTGAQALWILYV